LIEFSEGSNEQAGKKSSSLEATKNNRNFLIRCDCYFTNAAADDGNDNN